ncbi:MAG: hypothetical protein KDN22_13445, partial [Verrucomicrobiae bacterium]|nr:hypothetical protein [Verrucomicrobiae bacterium]
MLNPIPPKKNPLLRVSAILVCCGSLTAFAQETRRAEIAEEDAMEANETISTDVPETEEIAPGQGGFSADDLELQDVPEPPAVPNDLFIPEPEAVSANSYDPADLPPEVPLDQGLGGDTAIVASWQTQADARTLLLTVPAPRGQIVDRNGYCLAYNKVGFHYSIQFPRWDDPKPVQILAYARQRIEFLDKRTPDMPWSIKDKDILDHYQNRRWVPLINPRLVKRSDWEDIQKEMMTGIKVQPTYYRSYPHQTLAAHFLGYVGKKRPMSTGPIEMGEPLTIEGEGRTGLEKTYDKYLVGKPGEINVIFDADGNKLSEDIRKNPVEGNHVVTTIEREFQEIAESALSRHTRAGAMVIMDVWDGDIIAMASYPTFNPNSFVPGISQKDYTKLIEDKRNPLYARAYQGQYPPASTFKVPVALAALETDLISPSTTFNCGAYYKMPYGGSRLFPNWHRKDEGPMNVRRALKRSCNTFFYQAANKIGAEPILSMAARLGYGSKVGLPVEGESSGLLPSHEYMQKEYGYRLVGGALANLSIGQGKILATPLQIARGMCAVANGQYLPKARLIKHIQDLDGNIIEAFPIEKEGSLSVNPGNLKAVHAGMRGVVSDGDGTGKGADIGYPQLGGKTGTGRWRETRNVALF